MSKQTVITPKQKKAIKNIVSYLIGEEESHLDEHLATMHDIDSTEMSDEERAKACRKYGETDHAWYQLYILSTIK